jgi:hypothetical protein
VACTSITGTVKLSHGLSAVPAVQTMKVKGTLSGCTGEPFTQSNYSATAKTAGPVSCSVLSAGSEAATGGAKYKWTPNARHSHGSGTLSMLLAETSSVALSGEVMTGSYAPRSLAGSVSESYAGAATCGAKTVKKGTLSGSAISFE